MHDDTRFDTRSEVKRCISSTSVPNCPCAIFNRTTYVNGRQSAKRTDTTHENTEGIGQYWCLG